LAGEAAVKSCSAWAGAFAGKPAPTGERLHPGLPKEPGKAKAPCRSRLAGEEARKSCIAWPNAFAGKPAPSPPHSTNERFNN
ncbi:hypothetical protein F6S12_28705, partial [Pseudomonas sp. JV245A]|nr:hypothetical protein [Pseudomonas sp. JV245A]